MFEISVIWATPNSLHYSKAFYEYKYPRSTDGGKAQSLWIHTFLFSDGRSSWSDLYNILAKKSNFASGSVARRGPGEL